MIGQGLVIAEPYISQILSGDKTWELRSRQTTKRGPIALIKKGSGKIVGTALLSGVGPKLELGSFAKYYSKHRFPNEKARSPDFKWWVPWILDDVVKLDVPISYNHPSGAVTWVNLDPVVCERIARTYDFYSQPKSTLSPRKLEKRLRLRQFKR